MNPRTSVFVERLALIVSLTVVALTAVASAPADVTRSSASVALAGRLMPILQAKARAAPSAREPKTFIYVDGRRRGYVQGCCGGWEASWGADLFPEISKDDSRTFVSTCESRTRFGYAKRRLRTWWEIFEIGSWKQVGYARFVAPGRWNVYKLNGALAARTVGPNGVVAGLAWLTLRGCQ